MADVEGEAMQRLGRKTHADPECSRKEAREKSASAECQNPGSHTFRIYSQGSLAKAELSRESVLFLAES